TLAREPRGGWLDCLAGDLPMLGVVQYAGHPGLYLLSHGGPIGSAARTRHTFGDVAHWSSLGRTLDEVEPHFARIILALDRSAPAASGDALRGRAMDAWWGDVAAVSEARVDDVTARLGILFEPLEISAMLQPSLEAMADRVIVLGKGRLPATFGSPKPVA